MTHRPIEISHVFKSQLTHPLDPAACKEFGVIVLEFMPRDEAEEYMARVEALGEPEA